jgi:Tol biopolymer transport system component
LNPCLRVPQPRVAARLTTGCVAALLLVAAATTAAYGHHNGLIAFTRFADRSFSVGAVSPDGGPESTLVTDALSPAWSPDGKRLAFVSRRSGDYDLYVADADGTDPREFTRRGTDEIAPAWSPDGKRLAFVRGSAGGYSTEDERFGIYVINRDGSHPRRVTKKPGYFQDTPTWSPNGKWIAFALEDSVEVMRTELDLYLVHPNGRRLHRLTQTAADERNPSWAPDGTRLLFDRTPDGSGGHDLGVLKLGTRKTHLLIAAATDDSQPTWSPDGTMIAFTRWTYPSDDPDLENPRGAIYLADTNGANVRRLSIDSNDAWNAAWQSLP